MNKTHKKLLELRKTERQTLSEILSHLEVIQDQKVYLDMGYSSILHYCIKELGYSEAAAYRRIKALKLTKALPEVKEKIEDGSLSLSQLSKSQSLFEMAKCKSDKTKRELLSKVTNKNSKESENFIREELKLPKRKYRITLETSESTQSKWRELKQRMAHFGLNEAELFDRLLTEKLKELKETDRCQAKAPRSRHQRYISPTQKKFIRSRAGSSCEYIDPKSKMKCGSVYALEIDHIRPISQGGMSETENLRLLCKEHNNRFHKRSGTKYARAH